MLMFLSPKQTKTKGQSMNIRQEDIAAENILKRAELNRITRQLKSRLSKTNLKSKLKEKKSLSNISNHHHNTLHSSPAITKSNLTTPKRIHKKKSIESIDANKTEDEASPIRNNNNNLPPSSPLYEEFQIPIIPKTPPQQKITLNTDIYNSSSTNKTQINYSSPVAKQQGLSSSATQPPPQQHLSTPKRPRDEGADLLMFLATSPSPVQYKNYPSTPSRSITQSTTQTNIPSSSSQQQLLQPKSNNNGSHKFATPATPKRSINLMKTPGFNMNDYVNLFSPSPRISRTPGTITTTTTTMVNNSSGLNQINGLEHHHQQIEERNDIKDDVSGKLIKF
ncbi:unnamed protein product [Wickerhamomyces anomalus]